MSQVTIRTQQDERETPIRKRTKVDRTRRYCAGCSKIIRVRQEFVTMPDGTVKHFMCAAMDHEVQSCGGCFMIPADCTC